MPISEIGIWLGNRFAGRPLVACEPTLAPLRRAAAQTALAIRTAPAAFRKLGGRGPKPDRFQMPVMASRAAVVGPSFQKARGLRCFHNERDPRLVDYRAEILAVPARLLLETDCGMPASSTALPCPDRALVVFTGWGCGWLDDAARDRLWRVFQVPIFEQFLSLEGRLLAYECEAHDGLHVRRDEALGDTSWGGECSELLIAGHTNLEYPVPRLAPGLSGVLVNDRCGCGQEGLRLLELTRIAEVETRVARAAGEPQQHLCREQLPQLIRMPLPGRESRRPSTRNAQTKAAAAGKAATG